MEWLYYLLEANLYLLLFYAFYFVALQNQTFYNNNRYYLLVSSLTAFLIPILQLGFLKPAAIIDNALFPPPVILTAEQMAQLRFTQAQEPINYTDYLYVLYLLVAIGFAIKLSFNLFKIIRLWLKANKTNKGKVTLIELKDQSTAFSFFNLLFIHPSLANKTTVLKHEMVHIQQKHSFDILFFEILQVVCWFNPIIYFIKKDVKLLHEYIADEESTSSDADKHAYAMFLIENSFGTATTPLANQFFNQSILKRRINMLNQKKSVGLSRLRLLLALPLTGAMLCTSTLVFSKTYGYFDLLPEKSKTTDAIQQETKVAEQAKTQENQVKFPPPIPNQTVFYPNHEYSVKTNQLKQTDKRYIVINNVGIADNSKFYGVKNTKSVTYLSPNKAVNKYGEKAQFGAVEITGEGINYLDEKSVVPPPKQNQVKFPLPIVKPDGKKLKTPPAVEPPPPGYKTKKDQVKFPPPIVKPDAKKSSGDQIKLPPPIVKPDKKIVDEQSAKKSVFKTTDDKNSVTVFKATLEKKSNNEKMIKLYNASRYQTLFYPSKKTTPEEGC